MLSNHGGRQLDYTMSGLRTLPEIAAEAKGMTIMVDGGIRRGTDVIKALALGAHFVWIGRPFLYAAIAGGEAGVQRAITLLKAEIDRDLALLGHSLDQRDHAGSGAEVLKAIVARRALKSRSTESPPMRAWVRPPVAITSPNTISSRRGASQIVISAVPKWLRT